MHAQVFVGRFCLEVGVVEFVCKWNGFDNTGESDMMTFVRSKNHLPLGFAVLKSSQVILKSMAVIPIYYWSVN